MSFSYGALHKFYHSPVERRKAHQILPWDVSWETVERMVPSSHGGPYKTAPSPAWMMKLPQARLRALRRIKLNNSRGRSARRAWRRYRTLAKQVFGSVSKSASKVAKERFIRKFRYNPSIPRKLILR